MLVGENQKAILKFDQGRSYCAFVGKSLNVQNHLFSLYFDTQAKTGKGSNIIKRRPSRFVFFLEGKMKKGQGDHIFAFSTINLIIASLFSERTLAEFTEIIHLIFHPWIRVLYKFNQEFLEKNEKNLAKKVDFESFYNYFNSFGEQFLDVQFFYELIDGESDIEAINDYLNIACIFYHNLPLTVFGNGPAGKNQGTGHYNQRLKDIDLVKQPSLASLLTNMGYILPNIIDAKAMDELMSCSEQKSYHDIIGHIILHIYLVIASKMKKQPKEIVNHITMIPYDLEFLIMQFLGDNKDLFDEIRSKVNPSLKEVSRLFRTLSTNPKNKLKLSNGYHY